MVIFFTEKNLKSNGKCKKRKKIAGFDLFFILLRHYFNTQKYIKFMEAIREIMRADMLLPIINLPWKSKDMQVEVIVMPVEEENRRKIDFKKLKGRLKEYANPALWEKEQHAWEDSIVEKYGNI